ncbi:MAG: DinB family protein [Acidobacteriota bacterium]
MAELEEVLAGESYAAAPGKILEALNDELAHRVPEGAPHSIYEEVWHLAFWQQISLDWIAGVETPYPASPRDGFPTVLDAERETWNELRERFLGGAAEAAAAARNTAELEKPVRCPSRPEEPVRVMSVREQLENLGAHNAYHLGRVVLLRQLLGVWPPPSGGFGW